MDDNYDYLYNRVLDVCYLIHIPVKVFSMFVVLNYTPKYHRYHSHFVLHIMFWNFICNLILTFMHLNPLFPAECFRLDVIANLLVISEAFGHVVFMAELTALSHCAVALVSAFAYRYIVFAHPHFAANTKAHRVAIFCCGVHLLTTFLILPSAFYWMVNYDDYPDKAELPDRKSILCFYPHGPRKIIGFSTYLVFIVALVSVGLFFAILILIKLHSKKYISHSQTLDLQRKLFISLIIVSAVTLFFGAIPFLICVVATCFPHLPCARYMLMVSIVVLSNHGTIYSVAYLILFKAYRDAVKRMILKFFGKAMSMNNVVNTVHLHAVTA